MMKEEEENFISFLVNNCYMTQIVFNQINRPTHASHVRVCVLTKMPSLN